MNNAANSENDHATTPHTTPGGPNEFKTSAPPSRFPLLPLPPRQTNQRPSSPLPLPPPPIPPHSSHFRLFPGLFPLLHIIRLNQDPCFVPFSIFHAPCSHAPRSFAFWIRCFSLKHVRFLQASNHASPN